MKINKLACFFVGALFFSSAFATQTASNTATQTASKAATETARKTATEAAPQTATQPATQETTPHEVSTPSGTALQSPKAATQSFKTTPQSSNGITVRVTLDTIEAIKTADKGGDELYFDITQYSNRGRAKTDRIPEAPEHWLSKQLPEVKNVLLWEGVVDEQEELKVIISLVEQDTAPWDVDDLIGSALLILENKKGKLIQRWELPVFEDHVSQEMLESHNPQRFIMRGDQSQYNIAFKVTTGNINKDQSKTKQSTDQSKTGQSKTEQTPDQTKTDHSNAAPSKSEKK